MYKKQSVKINKKSKILILGSSGMVGSALVRYFNKNGFENILTPKRKELDLREQEKVRNYFEQNKPEIVFHLAAIVGGIKANNEFPAEFIYDNTIMHSNIFAAAWKSGVKKVIFPGSACTYPKMAPQPVKEESFLDGKIEPTNIAYATAKINGIIMAQSFAKQYGLDVIIPMPTNSYGVGDNFDPEKSHVIPALMQRFHQAKLDNLSEVTIWGTGKALREFLYVDDFVEGLIFLLENYSSSELINLSVMDEISMFDLAKKIADVVGFKGKIKTDTTKPDGAPRKCLDNAKISALGFCPKISLDEGLKIMYQHHFNEQNRKEA